MSSRSRFAGLPPELFDMILAWIEDPVDLTSLGYTCSSFSKTIIPYYAQMRYIRCDLHRDEVWNAINLHPQLALRIFLVRLVDETLEESEGVPILYPVGITGVLEDENEPRLQSVAHRAHHLAPCIEAISRMRNLKTFIAARPLKISATATANFFLKLVASCPHLEDFQVSMLNSIELPEGRERLVVSDLAFWNLKNLSRVVISIAYSDFYNAGEDLALKDAVTQMIIPCPPLTCLYLDIDICPRIPSLLLQGHWPLLTHFTIIDMLLFEADAADVDRARILSQFWDRHQMLECVYLSAEGERGIFNRQTGWSLPWIFPHSLPHLRSLAIPNQDIPLTSTLPHEIFKRLTHLEASLSKCDIDFFKPMTLLRSLIVHGIPDFLPDFFPYLKDLERLEADIGLTHTIPPVILDAHIASLSSLQKLRSLNGVFRWKVLSFGGHQSIPIDETMIFRIYMGTLCRGTQIKYVEGYDGHILLFRDAQGHLEDLYEVDVDEAGEVSLYWGDMFMGLQEHGEEFVD
ncbi:hypothetical protein BU17DRAFT_95405 [Hysterangium stoloniferum]|nr:hypothetical protein BU17DRAFT_95405 [Hysterangium stoloniferum]